MIKIRSMVKKCEGTNMKKMNFKHTLFACYIGYITQAIVVNFMPILFIVFNETYKVSLTNLGTLVLINFVTQITVDIIAARIIDRIGFRHAAVPAHILCAAGLVMLGILPSFMSNTYLALVISVIVYAVGGGLIEVVISPVVDGLPSKDNSAAMSLLHSFYCWGQLAVVLITTLVIKIFGYDVWQILSVVWAIVPIVNIFLFSKVPLPETCEEARVPIKQLLRESGFVIGLILMLGAGAAEQTMAQWVSLFAQKGLGVSKVLGDLLGPCMFALCMALGRMWYGIKGEKLDLKKALLGCSGLCILCYLVTVFSPNPLISLVSCALTGFSVSLMWPGTLSYNAACFPNGGAALFGVMALFGDIGCSVGPWLAGLVSDNVQNINKAVEFAQNAGLSSEQLGLKAGILMGIVFPIVMLLGLSCLKTEKIKRKIKKQLTNNMPV